MTASDLTGRQGVCAFSVRSVFLDCVTTPRRICWSLESEDKRNFNDKSVRTWLDTAMGSFKIPPRQCLKELRNTKWSFYVQAKRSFSVSDSDQGNKLATKPHLLAICYGTVVPKRLWMSVLWGCYWALKPHLLAVCYRTVIPKRLWVSVVWGCYWALYGTPRKYFLLCHRSD